MVLQAVGIKDKSANKNYGNLEQYIQHVWELADRYQLRFPHNAKESPIRMIEMALWCLRGGTTKCCHRVME
jgi:hypothetical protein